ncbi:MAG TPA: carboxypeptidase regulatory-like domain-containing protein, partial [Bacteroidota bacterium]|nr:carboxypeptidase regulatory-like domain-containing protein [Bacteroidota bacterium]
MSASRPPRRLLLLLIPIALCAARSPGEAQSEERVTLSGTVRNAENGEVLIGAYVVVTDLKGVGASTNAYGFYSLTVPPGRYVLQVQYLGFKMLADTVMLRADRSLSF